MSLSHSNYILGMSIRPSPLPCLSRLLAFYIHLQARIEWCGGPPPPKHHEPLLQAFLLHTHIPKRACRKEAQNEKTTRAREKQGGEGRKREGENSAPKIITPHTTERTHTHLLGTWKYRQKEGFFCIIEGMVHKCSRPGGRPRRNMTAQTKTGVVWDRTAVIEQNQTHTRISRMSFLPPYIRVITEPLLSFQAREREPAPDNRLSIFL